MPGMWVGNFLRNNSKTDKGRREQRTKACFGRFDINTYLSPSQLNGYRAGMHWVVVFLYSSC